MVAKSTVGIGGAAATVGVSAGTLRLWEAEGLVSPRRGPTGAREYTKRELAQIERVHQLRTVNNLNAPAIRHVLGLPARAPGIGDGVGSRPDLRALRRAAGLTINETARRAGLSVSFLSALERGLAGASPGTVTRVLAALGETGPWFDNHRTAEPVRRGAGKTVQVTSDIRNEWLADQPGLLEVIRRTLEPGATSGGPQEHEGEEFILILDGAFAIDLAGVTYVLDTGDSLHFPSHIVHTWHNPGPTTSTVLWVSTEIGIWSNLALSGRVRRRERVSSDGEQLVARESAGADGISLPEMEVR